MSSQLTTVVPVWICAAVAAVLVGVFAEAPDHFGWLAISMAAIVIVTFCAQLAFVQKDGFVVRVMLSLSGAVAILMIATVVLGLAALA
ncbi:hypothetical protein [Marisediminicola senii]|uniref:hypothetical protein n=1 Tax=Marisediminicola senii TaxID=2711233 RepID=UPI0013EAF470|nr:hypothetical protein [Marisediminicola senii]